MTAKLSPVARELDERRQKAHQEIMARPGQDLSDLSDTEFDVGRKRLQKVQARMEILLANELKEGVHYDNPSGKYGKRMLRKAGAEEIRRLMRLRITRMADHEVIATDTWVSVTVRLGIVDASGRLIAEHTANCNSSEEQFRDSRGNWTYRDPREVLHLCTTTAEKRCSAELTKEASGATGFFQSDDALDAAVTSGRAATECTEQDRARIKAAGIEKQMSRESFLSVIVHATGRAVDQKDGEPVVMTNEVEMVLEAIHAWQPRRPVETIVIHHAKEVAHA